MTYLNSRDRSRGALLGLAVGDALGAPLEGAPAHEAAAAVADGLEMTGGGWWAPGEWTDDTAMALALAESIASSGLLDADDLALRYIAWAAGGGKGIGRCTHAALVGARDAEQARAQARVHYQSSGLAAGNGTVMRATPIGLAARDIGEAVQAARDDAELTHADPAAAVASSSLCAALLAVRAGGDPLAAARDQARDHPRIADALKAVTEGDEERLGRLAYSPEAGACWTTLALGLYALVRHDDYERGVSWAIAQGGDTDTNAAVAGALLGARHGERTIPARWIGQLRERERVQRAADALQSH